MKQSDETRLAELFDRFSPTPSEAFYQRSFPWKGNTTSMKKRSLYVAASMAAAFVLITLAVLSPLRTLAQDTINLFVHSDSNTRPEAPFNPAPPDVAATYEAGIHPASSTVITDAEAQVGYDIPEPAFMPDFLSLDTVTYSSGQVMMDYKDTNGNNILHISILPSEEPYQSDVGASAQIETLTIGDVSAQYVQGLWMGQDGSTDATWFELRSCRQSRGGKTGCRSK